MVGGLRLRRVAIIDWRVPVDSEYNRHFLDGKRLWLPRRDDLQGPIAYRLVSPEVLIHERNSDDNNLPVLEVKKPNELLDYDRLKLTEFKDELRYRYAAHVVIGMNWRGRPLREVHWV